jgi:hypothetical protein
MDSKQMNARIKYYDQLVKKIAIYGAGTFFILGTLITFLFTK